MKKRIMAIAFAFMCLLSACTTNHQSNSDKAGANPTDSSRTINYTNIIPNEAQKRLDNEKEIILLDVRTQEEYKEKHIPNSQLIPVEVIEKEALTKLTDKNASIFVYCRSGRRSVTAAEALVKMGYTKVYNLGGINDWPYEVASGK